MTRVVALPLWQQQRQGKKRKAVSIMDDSIPMKRCTRCGQLKPLTSDYFYPRKDRPSGFVSACKECVSKKVPPVVKSIDVEHMGQKLCLKCNQWKPATLEYFHVQKHNAQGLRSYCKQCRSRAHPKTVKPGFKHCCSCKQEWPATTEYFHFQRSKKDGFRSVCKKCRPEQDRIYRSKLTPEQKSKRKDSYKRWTKTDKYKRYRMSHAEECKARNARYKKLHPEKTRENARRYREKNKNKLVQYHRPKYRTPLERERWLAYSRKQQFIRAMQIKANGGTHTKQDIVNQYFAQKGKCYWCDKTLKGYHVDHVIPVSRGGTDDPSNLVISCPTCNLKKGNKLPHEWKDNPKLQ